jgi:SAM-dependent methyltransferase
LYASKLELTYAAEMYRVLKPGGHLGFTAWDKTGWPRGLHGAGIKFPVPLTSVWTEEAYIKKFLGGEYFSFADVHVENLAFETVHEDVEGFLELMNVLLGNKLKEGDFDKYCEFVRKDSAEEGKKGWEGKWQATIVVATKSQ